MTRKPPQSPCFQERNPLAEPLSGTGLIFLAKKDIAEPAEPFPTQHARNDKYMTKKGKSFICRFRWFRCKAFLQNVWEKVPQVPLRPLAMAGKGGAA